MIREVEAKKNKVKERGKIWEKEIKGCLARESEKMKGKRHVRAIKDATLK